MSELLEDQIEALSGLAESNDDVVLSGYLGRLVKQGVVSARGAQKIQKATQATVQKKVLASTASRAQRFIMGKAASLDVQVRKDIISGNNQFEELDIYLRSEIVGGNTTSLIKASNQSKVGITNLNGNALPVGTAAAIEKLKISYGTDTATTPNPANVVYTNAMDAETAGSTPTAIPTAFINGEVEVKVNNTVKLRVPVKRFFRESLSVGTGVEGLNDCLTLKTPILVQGGERLEVTLLSADGLTLPTASKHYVELRMIGAVVAPR